MPFLLAAAATEKEHNAGGKNNESTWFNKGLAWWVGANATQKKRLETQLPTIRLEFISKVV